MNSLLHHPLDSFLFISSIFILIVAPKPTASFEILEADLVKIKYKQRLLPNVTGPESIAFDCKGRGPYVGVSDGRILRWRPALQGWSEYAVNSPNRKRKLCDGSTDPKLEQICGRPLGLKFDNRTCDLYIADAYFGLLKVKRGGGVAERLATGYDGVPFKLTNAVDIDSVTGEVYFTDSSRIYQRREFVLAILQGDRSGRVMKYDPRTRKVTVLLSGLSFPNGLAISKDNSFLIIAETGQVQLLRFWIRGPRAGTKDVFAELARYPDNIKRNEKGEFWVGINSGRNLEKEINTIGSGNEAQNIPWFTKDPVALKYDEEGRVVEVVDGRNEKTFESVSEVVEFRGSLWIGSVVTPYLGKFRA